MPRIIVGIDDDLRNMINGLIMKKQRENNLKDAPSAIYQIWLESIKSIYNDLISNYLYSLSEDFMLDWMAEDDVETNIYNDLDDNDMCLSIYHSLIYNEINELGNCAITQSLLEKINSDIADDDGDDDIAEIVKTALTICIRDILPTSDEIKPIAQLIIETIPYEIACTYQYGYGTISADGYAMILELEQEVLENNIIELDDLEESLGTYRKKYN